VWGAVEGSSGGDVGAVGGADELPDVSGDRVTEEPWVFEDAGGSYRLHGVLAVEASVVALRDLGAWIRARVPSPLVEVLTRQ
jgi:hypothetical protein